MVKIEIKQREDSGRWVHMKTSEFVGKTIEEFFLAAAGREIVAEITVDDRRMFFCGTDHWRERMSGKGQAILFDQGVARLKEINPELLTETIPDIDLVNNVFGGCEVISHTTTGAILPGQRQATKGTT